MISNFARALLGAGALVSQFSGAFAQDATSDLGTSDAPTYPLWIQDGRDDSTTPPWGALDVKTNQYQTTPVTNKTRNFEFTVSRGTVNLNGVAKQVILVNNQFPGPTLSANWGDWFNVTVKNEIADEGTSLHWHGLLQKGTQSMDGVPGIDHCPLAPGDSRSFVFRADMYGSSWWHSHYTAQYAGGLFGPMIIHGPVQKGVSYTTDVGPVILSDYAYQPYEQIVANVVGAHTNGAGTSNISLIQGKTDARFFFKSGDSYRMRLVNTAADATYIFSIDDHEFTVIAHDFVPVEPYVTKNISLAVAQRADIIVNATGEATGSYWMRARATSCSGIETDGFNATAAIFYQQASTKSNPTTKALDIDNSCNAFPDTSVGIPESVIARPAAPSNPTELFIAAGVNSTGSTLWWINNSTFRANYDEPPLLLASEGNTSFPSGWNVYNHGDAGSVRIILTNTVPVQHPMHLHGHNFQVVAQGYGKWDGTANVVNANSNPPRRDTYILNAATAFNGTEDTRSYLVLEYETDNPGVWPFHCHIAWHVSAGLYTSQMEKPDQIGAQPADAHQTCKNWHAWQAKGNIVDQIDSGEKIRRALSWAA